MDLYIGGPFITAAKPQITFLDTLHIFDAIPKPYMSKLFLRHFATLLNGTSIPGFLNKSSILHCYENVT